MIVDERMTAFINSLDTGNTPFLTELEVKALEDHVPIIRREMQLSQGAAADAASGQYIGSRDSSWIFHTAVL